MTRFDKNRLAPRFLLPAAAALASLVGCQLPPAPAKTSPQRPAAPTASAELVPASVSTPEPGTQASIGSTPPGETPARVPAPTPPPPPNVARPTPQPSFAVAPKDYRRDAARHLYQLNQHRVFAGKLPPDLYAIGVFEVDINARGQVVSTRWLRMPRHAMEVVAEIERTVREAAPYPAPARLGRVTYTDVWLWDKSGRFQLDTLTEGQL